LRNRFCAVLVVVVFEFLSHFPNLSGPAGEAKSVKTHHHVDGNHADAIRKTVGYQ
jgi:hypothetical protein